MVAIPHQTDEQLELFALGRLGEPDVAAVEEHLLVCAACRDRLDEVEMFALAMRRAIADQPASQVSGRWLDWFRLPNLEKPAWAWGAVFAAILIAAVLYLNSGRDLAPLATLELTAVRGGVPSVTAAKETDLTLTDAPAEPGLRAEVVDATGGTIPSSAFPRDSYQIRLTTRLAAGNYFVRLYDGSGRLLHEYGFRVRSGL